MAYKNTSQDFSTVYAATRPKPSESLINTICNQLSETVKPDQLTGKWSTAVDVGCGTGQVTCLLAQHFNQVYGFDKNQSQIEIAMKNNPNSNINYQISPAEEIPLKSETVQLITACECLPYFDLDKFNCEANRLLVKGGVFAAMGYLPYPKLTLDSTDNNSRAIEVDQLNQLMVKIIDKFEEHGISSKAAIEQFSLKYDGLKLPFSRNIRLDNFEADLHVNANYIIDLIKSYGIYALLKQVNSQSADDLLIWIEKELINILNCSDLSSVTLKVTFNYFLVMSIK